MNHFTEKDRQAVLAELSNANDRTCAIVGLSVLEPLVEQVLFKRLRAVEGTGQKAPDKDFKSAFNSLVAIGKPLDGFVSQCTLLYLLRGYGAWVYSDLKLLAKIRNRFAHNAVLDDEHQITPRKPAFASGKIAAWCRELKGPEIDLGKSSMSSTALKPDNPRHRFVWTVLALATAFANQLDGSSDDASSQAIANTASLASGDNPDQASRSENGT